MGLRLLCAAGQIERTATDAAGEAWAKGNRGRETAFSLDFWTVEGSFFDTAPQIAWYDRKCQRLTQVVLT